MSSSERKRTHGLQPKAYALAMRIFVITKRFPSEERYALTGQLRRSSRSVCMNLREVSAVANVSLAFRE